ncbi:hypothetical protein HYY75_06325 [bacterium]|nr:hypothetical protein [bacterium]
MVKNGSRVIALFFAILFFHSLPIYSQGRSEILLIDDDAGSMLSPWRSGIRSSSKSYDEIDTDQTPVTLELLKNYKTVIWVTGGSSELSTAEMNILEDYIDDDGQALVSGESTGSDLDWGGLDSSYFGFDYEKNTRRKVQVKSLESSIGDFTVSTDYGKPSGGKVVFTFDPNAEGSEASELAGKTCGVQYSRFFSKTIWLGFNLDDVSSSHDQDEIVENCLAYFEWGFRNGINLYKKTFVGKLEDLDYRVAKRERIAKRIFGEFKQIADDGDKAKVKEVLQFLAAEKSPELESLKKKAETLFRFNSLHNSPGK